jgi:hypothetical protein
MSFAKAAISKRRDRVIATLLTEKEYLCDDHLPKEISEELRRVILDEVNDLANFCIDVAVSLETGGVVFNEEYTKKLDEIHAALMEQ